MKIISNKATIVTDEGSIEFEAIKDNPATKEIERLEALLEIRTNELEDIRDAVNKSRFRKSIMSKLVKERKQ